jgi:hypothetical protein
MTTVTMLKPIDARNFRPTALAMLRTAIILVATTAAIGRAQAALDIVVPAYFYPGNGSPWGAMTAAADEVSITAIMNPGNGPGNAIDANYVAAVNAFRAAGGRVIGYVYSSYGSRPLAQVTADVDKYAAWYGIDGIFVDEMANNGPAQKLNYYRDIYNHVKGIDPNWEVMGNPGTNTIEQYLLWPTADRFMVHENVGQDYPNYTPSAWNAEYDSQRFVHLIHTEASAATMEEHLQLAITRGTGGIYVTNDVMNNPWDTLPSYWQAEVNAVAQINAALLAADFNDNGTVDAADLAQWTGRFGTTPATKFDGDSDGDGDVDGSDFLQWQRQAGQTSLPAAAAAAVIPEPSSAVLVLLSALALRGQR